MSKKFYWQDGSKCTAKIPQRLLIVGQLGSIWCGSWSRSFVTSPTINCWIGSISIITSIDVGRIDSWVSRIFQNLGIRRGRKEAGNSAEESTQIYFIKRTRSYSHLGEHIVELETNLPFTLFLSLLSNFSYLPRNQYPVPTGKLPAAMFTICLNFLETFLSTQGQEKGATVPIYLWFLKSYFTGGTLHRKESKKMRIENLEPHAIAQYGGLFTSR